MNDRWLKAAAGLVVVLLCVIYISAGARVKPERSVALTNWEYRWGDQWTAGLSLVSDEQAERVDWKKANSVLTPSGKGSEKVLWLRTMLPDSIWMEPAVLLQAYQLFEVYAGGEQIYRFGHIDDSHVGRYQGTPVRLMPLSRGSLGHMLYVRIYSNQDNVGLTSEAKLGGRADLILYLLKGQADRLFFGLLYMVMGLFSLYAYFKFRQSSFFSFSAFAWLFGLYTICRTTIIYLFFDQPLFWMYTEFISLMLGTSAILFFCEQLFGSGWGGIMRKLWQLHAVCAAALLPLTALGLFEVPDMLRWYQYLLLASMIFGLSQIGRMAWKGNPEARLTLLGVLALCITSSIDIIHNMAFLDSSLPPLSYIGTLLFLFTLIRLMLRRVTDMIQRMQNTEKLSIVGQLAAGVAHEIRNPITIISGFLQLMAKEDRNVHLVEVMLPEVERINTIMGDFLVLAKPTEPKLELYAAGELLREIVPLFEPQAQERGIRLLLTCTEDPPIMCDKNQLKQVYVNLLKNAMEAMSGPGDILLSIGKAGARQIRIRIQDYGIGVEESLLEKLGEPFMTTKEGGTGLGLMICRRVVDSHGGRIRFDSRPGEGMIVDIFLPTA